MSFFKDLLEKPADLSAASKYLVMNGFFYLAVGGLLIVWPGAVQTIFMDAPFVGNESALFRAVGMSIGSALQGKATLARTPDHQGKHGGRARLNS